VGSEGCDAKEKRSARLLVSKIQKRMRIAKVPLQRQFCEGRSCTSPSFAIDGWQFCKEGKAV
jgi:hypothetical protein